MLSDQKLNEDENTTVSAAAWTEVPNCVTSVFDDNQPLGVASATAAAGYLNLPLTGLLAAPRSLCTLDSGISLGLCSVFSACLCLSLFSVCLSVCLQRLGVFLFGNISHELRDACRKVRTVLPCGVCVRARAVASLVSTWLLMPPCFVDRV